LEQVVIEIPHIFLQTAVYGLIVYSLIWTVEKFFWFMFFTFMYFTFYGMMAVAMTPNSDIAAIVSTLDRVLPSSTRYGTYLCRLPHPPPGKCPRVVALALRTLHYSLHPSFLCAAGC
jgi:hypothetical protein